MTKKKKPMTPEQAAIVGEQAAQLRAEGLSWEKIAGRIGFNRRTITKFARIFRDEGGAEAVKQHVIDAEINRRKVQAEKRNERPELEGCEYNDLWRLAFRRNTSITVDAKQ